MSVLAHLDGVTAALEAAGLRVWVVSVTEPKPAYPYVLLWPTTGKDFSDALCDDRGELDFTLGVTCAGLTPTSVLVVNERVRAILRAPPSVSGWAMNEPEITDTQPVMVDESVALDAPGEHPFFAVDLYQVTSQRDPHNQ